MKATKKSPKKKWFQSSPTPELLAGTGSFSEVVLGLVIRLLLMLSSSAGH